MASIDGRPVTSVAVVDPVGNLGGGRRFLGRLLPAIARRRPDLGLTVIGAPSLSTDDQMRRSIDGAKAEFKPLRSLHVKSGRSRGERLFGVPGLSLTATKFQSMANGRWARLPAAVRGDVQAELEQELVGYGAAIFTWPYGFMPPRVTMPMLATVHDLNYKYFFGAPVWTVAETAEIEEQMRAWLQAATVVTSCAFMADEVRRFYPSAKRAQVVRLSSLADTTSRPPPGATERLAAMGVTKPFILCANHAMVHKNIGPVIGAMQRLAVQRPDLKLVLTGARTDGASGRATALGIERTADGANVVGLGYVSDAAMADLITEASVVVNPSLYEAGNGSGLDAWGFGTPVAMSDIPPFTEHLTALGVQAELFDPRDPDAIASSIARIIDNRRQAQQAATASEAAMQHHTWDDVADGYLAVLDGAVQGGASQ